jgi:hypothetical protein
MEESLGGAKATAASWREPGIAVKMRLSGDGTVAERPPRNDGTAVNGWLVLVGVGETEETRGQPPATSPAHIPRRP